MFLLCLGSDLISGVENWKLMLSSDMCYQGGTRQALATASKSVFLQEKHPLCHDAAP